MGLTGGFADVGGLYDCLYGIYTGVADDTILDKYDEIRREKYLNVIDPISSGNLRRLWDPTTIEDDDFIKMVRRTESDKDFAEQMREVSIILPAVEDGHWLTKALMQGCERCDVRLHPAL